MRTQDRPVLDQESFQQLLAAAFVLQEHNDRLRAKEPQADYTHALSTIAETQRLIQHRQLDLAAAAKLIAEQTRKVTHASGTAIAVVQGDQLVYCAGSGSATGEAASQLPIDASLSAVCVREGKILQCADTEKDSRLPAELCRALRVQSLLAIPVYHEGKVAGVLELRFAEPNSFHQHDVHTCQLMAGLVTEAIARAAELDWKQALAAERATMLEALEKLKPQLERMAEPPVPLGQSDNGSSLTTAPAVPTRPNDTPAVDTATNSAVLAPSVSPAVPAENHTELAATPTVPVAPAHPPVARESGAALCHLCDHPLAEEEFFCGICGTARVGDLPPRRQKKWGSVARLQQAAERKREELSKQADTAGGSEQAVLPASLEDMIAQYTAVSDGKPEHQESVQASVEEHGVAKFAFHEDALIRPAAARPPAFEDASEEFAAEDDSAADTATEDADTKLATDAAADLTPEEEVQLALLRDSIPAPAEIVLPSPWTSAVKARQWLEALKTQQEPRRIWLARQWHGHRANIYLAASALLLFGVLVQVVFSGGGKQSAQDPSSAATSAAANTRRRRLPPKPQLTLFEQLLVGIGLAEPPPTPTYLGNPDTRVWVDLHTALYYCPGADLYGKTPDGKFTTQRDAQQDQFEPARRRACD